MLLSRCIHQACLRTTAFSVPLFMLASMQASAATGDNNNQQLIQQQQRQRALEQQLLPPTPICQWLI